MNLLVTGENGFIGKNLLNRISLLEGYSVFYINRYNNLIFPFVPKKIDYVIHLSSVHRLEPESLIYEENKKINQHLINVLNFHSLKSNILFTSSIHENSDTFYGKSKRDSTLYFKDICKSWNKEFIKITFPNIFGPFAKPYHTSVVANFCSDIIQNKKSHINNVDLEIIYVKKAVNAILNFQSINVFETQKINLKELYNKINHIYKMHTIKNSITLEDTLDAELFITLKSYLK